MAWRLVARTKFAGGVNGGTTPAVDTTGADLIILCASHYQPSAITVSDNKGNAYTARADYNDGHYSDIQVFDCRGGTVGTGHTFTISNVSGSSFSSLAVLAFSGSATTGYYDKSVGTYEAGGNFTSFQTPSITPSNVNSLIISTLSSTGDTTTGLTVDSGFTISDSAPGVTSRTMGVVGSYLIQKAGPTAVSPKFSWTHLDGYLAAGNYVYSSVNTGSGSGGSGIGTLSVIITWSDNTTTTINQTSATQQASFTATNFTQESFSVTINAKGQNLAGVIKNPPMTVLFRPDASPSTRIEVIFELGMANPMNDPTGAQASLPALNLMPWNYGQSWAYKVQVYNGGVLQTDYLGRTEINVPWHAMYARWRWQSAQRPIVNNATAVLSILNLPYGKSPGQITWESAYTHPVSTAINSYTNPMDTAGVIQHMPSPGGRPDIGPIPWWSAIWLLLDTLSASDIAAMTAPGSTPFSSSDAEAIMRATAEASASVPWCYRDASTGAPLDFTTYPQMNNYPGIGRQPQPQLFNPFALRDGPVSSNAQFTASCDASGVMTVTAVASGTIYAGEGLYDAAGYDGYNQINRGFVPVGLTISPQISGTTGGIGTYQLGYAKGLAFTAWGPGTVYTNPTYGGVQGGWEPELAHKPGLAYICAVATQDPFLIEQCQFEGNYAFVSDAAHSAAPGQAAPDYPVSAGGPIYPSGAALMNNSQERATAWSCRDMFFARKVTEYAASLGTLPSWLVPPSVWKTYTDNSLKVAMGYVNNPTPAGTALFLAGRLWTATTPWQQSYIGASWNMEVLFGFQEWLPAATWKSQLEIHRGNGQYGWPEAAFAQYALYDGPGLAIPDTSTVNISALGRISASSYYQSMADQWTDLTSKTGTSSAGGRPFFVWWGLITQQDLDAMAVDPTMGGIPAIHGPATPSIIYASYLDEARGVLALAAHNRIPGAAAALAIQDRYVAEPTRANEQLAHWSFTTPAAGSLPRTPTGLAATAVSSSEIDLSWNANSPGDNVTAYLLYRATGANQPFANTSLIATISAPMTSYRNTGLSQTTTFSYYLIAQNATGNSPNTTPGVDATTQAYPGSSMAWNLVAHTKFAGGVNGGTTPAVDTTGADLIILCASHYQPSAITVSDNKGNTYTARTDYNDGQYADIQVFDCQGGTVGTGHTFTISNVSGSSFSSLAVLAFSGSATTGYYDKSVGTYEAGGNFTSLQTPSITPSNANSLIISTLSSTGDTTTGLTVDSGFTITDSAPGVTSQTIGVVGSYLIQKAGPTAVSPKFSWTYVDGYLAAGNYVYSGVAGGSGVEPLTVVITWPDKTTSTVEWVP